MDRKARNAYRYLKYHSDKTFIDISTPPKNMSVIEFRDAVMYLRELKCVDFQYSLDDNSRIVGVRLNHYGKNKVEIDFQATVKAFFSKFFTGALIGAFAELLIIALTPSVREIAIKLLLWLSSR